MNQEQAGEMASVVTLIAKMKSDPVIMRYEKLKSFAASVGLGIEISNDVFEIRQGVKVLFRCDSTEGLNDWFQEHYMAEVL